jgi:hypothetical protein
VSIYNSHNIKSAHYLLSDVRPIYIMSLQNEKARCRQYNDIQVVTFIFICRPGEFISAYKMGRLFKHASQANFTELRRRGASDDHSGLLAL